ncbi:MAG: DUF1499 domain-containing protein [Deltaproteobacteria bacterium]|nr:DUF1499 domain-containing protein [Deltaproteobacteria bacterium]
MTGNRWSMGIAVVALLMITGCSGKHLTVRDDNTLSLDGCYPLPNCVSSTTWILYNRTSSFELAIPGKEAWPRIQAVVANIPRTQIVEENEVYIHAKCKSLVFRFVDNLELLLNPDENIVFVRSSSTIALFDFGVNRRRIYKLRKQLEKLKLIKQ